MNRLANLLRVALPAVILAVVVVLWVRSYWTVDTLTYHGESPSSVSISTEHGIVRVERSSITSGSDRVLRYWHGRDPIESDPNGEGIGGFHHYVAKSGSWTFSAPLWLVLVGAALYAIHYVRSVARMTFRLSDVEGQKFVQSPAAPRAPK